MSMNLWMDKQIVVYSYIGVLFSNNKEQVTDKRKKHDRTSKALCYVKEIKHNWQHMYDSNYMKLLKGKTWSKAVARG